MLQKVDCNRNLFFYEFLDYLDQWHPKTHGQLSRIEFFKRGLNIPFEVS